MGVPTLHLHEVRIGIGLPTKTVRPFARRGDAVLGGFLAALEEPAERVVITGRLFDGADPPAHLADRVARPLGRVAARGVPVHLPGDTPRALLFLAAGILLGDVDLPGAVEEFWSTGAYRILDGRQSERRRVSLPGNATVCVSVTGLSVKQALARIRSALSKKKDARLLRLILTGRTSEPELLSFGPRELSHQLPGGVEGVLDSRVEPARFAAASAGPGDEEERREALAAVRRKLPEAPETTGIYEFLDERGRALYVGKAVNLKRRIASHFTAEAREPSPRGPMLLAARDIRFRETAGELQALLAEAERIQDVRPPYNRQMRETEGYRYVCADPDAPYPTLTSSPRARRDGRVFIGPFAKRWLVERSLRVLMVAYGLKACDWTAGEPVPRACTDRDLAICSAPCTGRVGPEDYRARFHLALDHLMGRDGPTPALGTVNPPSAGLLAREDLRILDGFLRSVRWFLENLREANGTIPLAGGEMLLVLGGRRAGVRRPGRDGDAGIAAWAGARIEAYRSAPAPTWVRPEQVDEVRILSQALRNGSGCGGLPSKPAAGNDMTSLP